MIKRKWSQILKREEGSGLILALMTLMVLSVLGISLGMITVNGFRLSHINRDSTSVYYIAEAGANQAFEDIRSGVMGIYSEETNSSEFLNKVENQYLGLTQVYTDFDPQNGKVPQATIEVVEGEGDNDYILRSTGTIGNASRTVEKAFGVNWVEKRRTGEFIPDTPFNPAVVAREKLTIGNNARISGKLITEDKYEPGAVYFDSTVSSNLSTGNENRLNIDVFLPTNANLKNFNEKNPEKVRYNLRKNDLNWDLYKEFLNNFPNFDTIALDKVSSFNDTSIDTDGKVKRFLVDTLDLSKGLSIEGTGRVDFYVNDEVILGGNINTENLKDSRQLQIFHRGNKISFTDNTTNFYGTLFSKQANITLPGSSIINGVIITGGNNFTMGHILGEFLIIIPSGTINYNNSSRNNAISGIMVAESIIFSENASVQLSSEYLDNFPLVLPGFADDEFNENGEVIEPGSILEVR